jgi:RimJ/RimL family protein N-acetyltransferase
MQHIRKIVGETCYLSPPAPEDAADWTCWLNDLEVAVPLGDEAYEPVTLEGQTGLLGAAARGGVHAFAVVALKDDRPLGRCLLFDVNHVDRRGMMGIFLGQKGDWDQGLGQEATRLLLDYAFNLLNLHNVMLGTFSFNERALRCYQKVGFREFGRRREARLLGGRWYDLVFMDLLAPEFRERYASCLPLPG